MSRMLIDNVFTVTRGLSRSLLHRDYGFNLDLDYLYCNSSRRSWFGSRSFRCSCSRLGLTLGGLRCSFLLIRRGGRSRGRRIGFSLNGRRLRNPDHRTGRYVRHRRRGSCLYSGIGHHERSSDERG